MLAPTPRFLAPVLTPHGVLRREARDAEFPLDEAVADRLAASSTRESEVGDDGQGAGARGEEDEGEDDGCFAPARFEREARQASSCRRHGRRSTASGEMDRPRAQFSRMRGAPAVALRLGTRGRPS